MTARPRVRLHKFHRPFLMMKSYQHELENYKCAGSEFAPKLKDQSEGHLRDQLLQCVEGDMVSKLGIDRLAGIPSSQLMAEIERASVQKQLDLFNKVKLFEAVQGPREPIKNFLFRLQMLAYECNFTTSCSSQNCTAPNYGGDILVAIVRGRVGYSRGTWEPGSQEILGPQAKYLAGVTPFS